MSDHRSATRAASHEEVAALIPWFVNETLAERDRVRVEEHLLVCAGCREELALERRIREAMRADGPLEFMPAASLNRLRSRLDEQSVERDPQTAAELRGRPLRRRQWLTAASFAGAMAAAVLWAGHWNASPSRPGAPVFHTVTDSVPHAPGEVVRAVFVPTITLVDLQALLDEAQLRIIAGPSEAGVYSLAARSTMPVSTSLALLRRHATVRFAESTEPPAPDPAVRAGTTP